MELVEFRQIARNIFLLSIASVIIAFIIKLNNPVLYPGLEERLIWVCLFAGIITGILYFSDWFASYWKKRSTMYLEYKYGPNKQGKLPGLKSRPGFIQGSRNNLSSLKSMDRETLARLLFMYLFEILLIAFLLLSLARTLSPDFVSIIDSNYLIISVLFAGVISIAFPPTENQLMKPLNKNDYLFICFLGVAGSILIWYKIQGIGDLSYIIAPFVGLIIILLSFLALEED